MFLYDNRYDNRQPKIDVALNMSKPYPDFPLTAHRNGQWCKKIRGKVHYFGRIEDWQSALQLFQLQKDDLYAGRKPRSGDEPTLGELMNQFLWSKKLLVQSGEITARSYDDYQGTCDKIAESIGTSTIPPSQVIVTSPPVSSILCPPPSVFSSASCVLCPASS